MKNILCFGDSNTWGYNPLTKERYPKGIRWTSLLQEQLGLSNVNIIEEGLCGRTTVYDDSTRPNRKGIDSIRGIFNDKENIDQVIFMLGTNDCKTCNHTTAKDIADGIDSCLDIILEYVDADKVLLISPIHLGKNVWKAEFDPEFDENSVVVSKELKKEYLKVANQKSVNFLAASDYCSPSKEDQEHLNQRGHRLLANAIYEKLYYAQNQKAVSL